MQPGRLVLDREQGQTILKKDDTSVNARKGTEPLRIAVLRYVALADLFCTGFADKASE